MLGLYSGFGCQEQSSRPLADRIRGALSPERTFLSAASPAFTPGLGLPRWDGSSPQPTACPKSTKSRMRPQTNPPAPCYFLSQCWALISFSSSTFGPKLAGRILNRAR
jgi:hypothetical protein